MRMLDDPTRIVEFKDIIIRLNEKNALQDAAIGLDTKIHAEILVADFIYTQGLAFFDNDAYIACSKAACCCC